MRTRDGDKMKTRTRIRDEVGEKDEDRMKVTGQELEMITRRLK